MKVYKREVDGTTYYWKEGNIYSCPTLLDGTYDSANEMCIWDYEEIEYNELIGIESEVIEVLGDHSND